MSTQEHLNKIDAKCRELLVKYPKCESTAGWLATIAAIDRLNATLIALPIGHYASYPLLAMREEIIAAWTEDLL